VFVLQSSLTTRTSPIFSQPLIAIEAIVLPITDQVASHTQKEVAHRVGIFGHRRPASFAIHLCLVTYGQKIVRIIRIIIQIICMLFQGGFKVALVVLIDGINNKVTISAVKILVMGWTDRYEVRRIVVAMVVIVMMDL